MNDHIVTEHYIQSGNDRLATFSCSCGLSSAGDPRRIPIRVLKRDLSRMHENKQKPKSESKIVLHKEKKSKKQKPFYNYVDEPRDADDDDENTTVEDSKQEEEDTND